MRIATLVVTCVVPLALWILVSALDDVFITAVFFCTWRKPFPWPEDRALAAAAERPIAILVPLWSEQRVIGRMLEHNLRAIRYSNYDIFAGVYPNDDNTRRAVEAVAATHPRVHPVIGPHDGPTSKGDCLNWLYRGMERHEQECGIRYEVMMTHDAEDLADPDSLRLVNWFSRDYAMVQVPVLALATPIAELTHGLYCDEFAEFQTKDIPARQRLGGFLPANGVGTGFARAALEHLASTRGGMIFDPACLTEDYENGFRLHALGYRQIFLPVRLRDGRPVATREYFPRDFRGAARQRSRWVAGIALQGWQNHGWRGAWPQPYWFWRDRKGLVGNLLTPLANLFFVAGLGSFAARWKFAALVPLWLSRLCLVTYAVAIVQVGVRAWASARIYGWRFAAATPVRVAWSNVVNFVATVAAIRQFAAARLARRAIAWRKTEHVYPRPRLGEVLVAMRSVAMGEVETAAGALPKGVRLGEYLVRLRKLSEENLYRALSLQSGIPAGSVGVGEVDRQATRAFPAEVSRQWKVLPLHLDAGELHVATADLPSPKLRRELARFSAMEIRYRLVSSGEFARLEREYLPPRG
ncbi:MAG TPA: glycosyl transferase family protein [Bryobacteraceae bacterium]|nr:glycosyl transferase family protein [Bryobacteraceae bacterium]